MESQSGTGDVESEHIRSNDSHGSAIVAPATTLNPAPRRILVKEVNWLGDLVMSLPALRAIRRTWPAAHLAVLIKQELAGSFESALWLTLAGISRRAGFVADARGAMLNLKASRTPAAISGHQVNHWLEMVRATSVADGSIDDFALEVHQPHRERMREWLAARRTRVGAPLYAIAPAAAYGPAKEWPARNYAALIDLLGARFGAEVVLVGAPSERAKCEQVAAACKAGAIVAAGSTSIGELIALLSLCDGFIGNDSGCAHLAGALGIATVAIFGSTNPDRTGPLGAKTRVIYRKLECSPCLARTCRYGHYNCLTQIEPAELADAIHTLGGAT
jgi:heptosyltransferase-2